ncbi:MAG: TA system VapC family ribonuclease toxin [Phycicoccus sp.]
MKLVDANVLLNAVNASSADHRVARAWLDGALSGGSPVGLPWSCVLAFLRMSTQHRVFPRPLALDDALDVVDGWLGQPTVTVLHPTAHHHLLIAELLREVGVAGKLVNDAHLAALAVEHRATVVSFDADFARFARVRWERPTA